MAGNDNARTPSPAPLMKSRRVFNDVAALTEGEEESTRSKCYTAAMKAIRHVVLTARTAAAPDPSRTPPRQERGTPSGRTEPSPPSAWGWPALRSPTAP